uniref:PAZ domain-containing protein n=1 Tax=Macrostomum lignano TaxID=282301 RepID=A0A1I8IA24_9PLAT
MTVEEYHCAQLFSVAEASKQETGGGEGIMVVHNEPFDVKANKWPPKTPLLGNRANGQYTYKIYKLQNQRELLPLIATHPFELHPTHKPLHLLLLDPALNLSSKVPKFIRLLAPSGSLEMTETAWNAYPYCRTVVENPGYMKENFFIKIESMHVQDAGTQQNVHQLPPDLLSKREVVYIDIANDKLYSNSDYKREFDPKLFKSEKTDRGPLVNNPWWQNYNGPVMCAYKLVTCEFKWFGLQTRVESFIHTVRLLFIDCGL